MRSKVGLLIGLVALIATSCVASEARGLIVFTEPPSTYVQTLEFTSYVRSNIAYSTIVRTNGQREHVTNSGIMGIIDYPPAQISATDETQATAAIQQIQQLQQQCQRPDLAPKFQLALTRWQSVLSAIRSVAKPSQPIAPARTSTTSLAVDGTSYRGVTLTSVDDDTAGIRHSDGIARIPLASLDGKQIAALNNTTNAVQIDSDWRAKKVAKEKKLQAEAQAAAAREAERLKQAAEAEKERQVAAAAREAERLRQASEAAKEGQLAAAKAAENARLTDEKHNAQGALGGQVTGPSKKQFDPHEVSLMWLRSRLEHFSLGGIDLGMSLADLKRDCPDVIVMTRENMDSISEALSNGKDKFEYSDAMIEERDVTKVPGVIIAWCTTSPNAHLVQVALFSNQIFSISAGYTSESITRHMTEFATYMGFALGRGYDRMLQEKGEFEWNFSDIHRRVTIGFKTDSVMVTVDDTTIENAAQSFTLQRQRTLGDASSVSKDQTEANQDREISSDKGQADGKDAEFQQRHFVADCHELFPEAQSDKVALELTRQLVKGIDALPTEKADSLLMEMLATKDTSHLSAREFTKAFGEAYKMYLDKGFTEVSSNVKHINNCILQGVAASNYGAGGK